MRIARLVKRTVVILVLIAILIFAVSWLRHRDQKSEAAFRTVPVSRGDLLVTISATGTVEPEEVIDVGAQVAGKIVNFGQDQAGKPIDYGSIVEEGMVLAQIDDSLYAADVAQMKAQLEQAKAGMNRAEADLGQLQAKLYQAERDWNRARKLGPSDALSQSDYDAAQSAYDVAKANLAVGKAAILQARGAVSQAEANLRRAQQNLDYCTIRAPVKGVVIDRRVNIGQTVVASLNAPSLFLLAKDLKRMQVWVAVNEADVGHIRPGQPVSFTVDAFPGETFAGEVGKVRLNATMTQNVVNYTVEVITDNSSGKLLPYLTANVKFLVSERSQVLLVPNAALRWTPEPRQIVEEGRKPGEAGGAEGGGRAQPGGGAAGETGARGVIWVPQGNQVRSIPVRIGMTDASSTEIQGQDLKEGMRVVVGEQLKQQTASPASGTSPFTPQFFGRGRQPGGPEAGPGKGQEQRR